jgi:asparagine synthase (glutamine-hydrolysing)
MCGIAGLFDGRGKRDFEHGLLKRMADSIAHRGPDADGFYLAPGVALAHRRLAIIDLSSGQQPMFSTDGAAVIVFNGEIYNFGELTRELKALGQVFRTHSDTEVILNAWRAWGPACVTRFSGMFAFALWDIEQETLFLARDHLGKKPLYYTITADRRMAFASELKAILQCPWVSRRISAEAVEDYFALGYVPDPKSIYCDVLKLPPAHALVWRKGAAAPVLYAYWDLNLTQGSKLSAGDAAEELSSRFKNAVTRRLMAEVPLGAFLSGGVDSSGVVAHMAQASAQPIKTCTIGFGEDSHDERKYARIMAERYRTCHVEKVLDPDFTARAPHLLDRVAAAYDEPFADSSAIPTYQVCAAARESVTVALSGDGGDEAFGGYRRYRWHMREHAVRGALPGWMRSPVFGFLGTVYPHMAWAPRVLRARATFRELAMDEPTAYLNNVAAVRDDVRAELYAPGFKSDLQSYRAVDGISALMRKAPADDPLLQAQYVDAKTWLAGRMLVKVDRASMAHGLEVRSPLLDYELFQWALSLPARLKIDGNKHKAVLKKSLEPLVPHELMYRPKQGFGMPISAWFRGNLRPVIAKAITSPTLLDAGYFKPAALSRMVDEHISGRRDHGAVLWSILMFERFLAREQQSSETVDEDWQSRRREAVPAE